MQHPRRPAAAAAALAAAALLLSACGPAADGQNAAPPASASPPPPTGPVPTATTQPSPSGLPAATPIAQTRGDDGIVGEIYRVEKRDGIVTISAGARNDGQKDFYASAWSYTLAGSSLVDRTGKKRYLTLQDAKGTCLCTEIKSLIEPGETRLLYASFPAPPESTTEVDLQLATMQPVTIKLPAE